MPRTTQPYSAGARTSTVPSATWWWASGAATPLSCSSHGMIQSRQKLSSATKNVQFGEEPHAWLSQRQERCVPSLQGAASCMQWLVLKQSDLLIRKFDKRLNGKQLGNLPQEIPCVSCFWRSKVGETLTGFSALEILIWAERETIESDKNVLASSIIIKYYAFHV